MSYFSGMGELPTAQWCSDKNPTCKRPLRKICKPMTPDALSLSKTLQRQLNRQLAATTGKLLDVDGRPGPNTLSAVNTILGTNYDHCDQIMADLDTIVNRVSSITLVFPPVADPPKPKSPPSVVTPEGQVAHPKTAGIGGGLLGAAALLVGGYLVYQAVDKGPKKKRAKSSAYWF